MLMMLRRYQRGPGDRCHHQRSRLAGRCRRSDRKFSGIALPPAKLQKATEMRETGGGGLVLEGRHEETQRGRERVFVRDTARTSPRSQVEMLLYGCVCLSVLFRVFYREAPQARPSVIIISLPHRLVYYAQPSFFLFFLSLCFCCYPRNLLAVVTVTDGCC